MAKCLGWPTRSRRDFLLVLDIDNGYEYTESIVWLTRAPPSTRASIDQPVILSSSRMYRRNVYHIFIYIYMYIHVCICVSREISHLYIYMYIHTYRYNFYTVYIHIYNSGYK